MKFHIAKQVKDYVNVKREVVIFVFYLNVVEGI